MRSNNVTSTPSSASSRAQATPASPPPRTRIRSPISDDLRTEVQAAIDDVKKALEGTDVAEVKAKQETLNTVAQKIGEALYAAQSEAPEGATASEPAGSEEDVVDAEIVDDEEEAK